MIGFNIQKITWIHELHEFNSHDNLPLNKQLKFHTMTLTVRCVFKKDNKLYPQVFLDEVLFSL